MSGEADLKLTEKFEKSTVVLLDIAGTSSSICFVKDTLFPYILNKAEPFLTKSWENEEVQEIIKNLRENDSEILKEGEKDSIIKTIISSIKTLTENNSNLEAFKKFQGLLYKEGYDAGDIKGHVFPDVATQLPLWANGKRICVYSTGSIEAQKLLFTNSTEGNLSEHITEYFDMSAGVKTEATSYKTIAEKLKCKPEDIIFLTDSVTEAKAADEAGVTSVLVFREGNDEFSEEDKSSHPVINSFTELSSEVSGKRKITEEAEQEAPPAKVAKTEPEKTEKVAEATPAIDGEEKMEVDSEIPQNKKEESMEHNTNDTETVTSTSEVVEETKEAENTVASTTVTNDVELKHEKTVEKENEKDVPSTKEKQEPSVGEKSENKTEETKDVSMSETKIKEDEKQTEKMEVTTDSKETEKEILAETTEIVGSTGNKETKETVDSTENKEVTETVNSSENKEIKETVDSTENKEIKEAVDSTENKEVKEAVESTEKKETVESTENKAAKEKVESMECSGTQDKVDSSNEIKEELKTDTNESDVKEIKEEPKVKNNETSTETKEKPAVEGPVTNDKECEEKQETEETKENIKTESDVAKVDEPVEKPDETKEPILETNESTPKINDIAKEERVENKETNVVDGVAEKIEKTTETEVEKVPVKDSDEEESKNTKENGESSSETGKDKINEKENQSELANGAHLENGDETKKLSEEEAEIKVKKIESESSETEQAAVSVEVTA